MDWASSQWKEGLSSSALQQVSSLEEKIEKLQKERQQKQHQLDCLELTLNKEKRKVEEEKQLTKHLERELQSVQDFCKNLESKQQNLLKDIQNRDSRINNLEGQLGQAKKQNSRLQQLEKDLEDLKCLRETTKLEKRQLEEKLKNEQSSNLKKCDAISDLEQTIRSLQGKHNSESSVLLIDVDKENINSLNCSSSENLCNESLNKIILEQKNTIINLKEQLTQLSGSNQKLLQPTTDPFSTPAKKNILSETSVSSAKKSFSLWDNFGSTPAKSGKLVKHLNDSSTFDTDSDEKVRTLQLKLKQVCQELECQRHNFEATKNAIEQKFKEKENVLKVEIKQQAQTIYDLDKELQEMKIKYQQDVVQTSKKLDVVNGQLQKSELAKQQADKDLKAIELQLSSRNNELQLKEEELKDLLKIKNSLEASTKSLQCEKRELDRNCSILTSQKKSLTEEIEDLKVRLDGSNNLVKEKESIISALKKDQDLSLKTNSDLQTKMQALNKDKSRIESEKNSLEKQLQELSVEISVLKQNFENLKEEKKNVCATLDLEKSRSQKLDSDLIEKGKEVLSLQSEVQSKENDIMKLRTEIEECRNSYSKQLSETEQTVSLLKSDKSSLETQLKEYVLKEETLKETLLKTQAEEQNLSKLLTSEKEKAEGLITELTKFKTDLEDKNKQLSETEQTVSLLKSDKSSLETQLKEYVLKEETLKETLLKTQAEEQNLSKLLTTEKEKAEGLITELTKIKTDLEDKNKLLSETEQTVSLLKSDKSSLETQLKEYVLKEETLKETLLKTQAEEQNLSKLLTTEKEKAEGLITELTKIKTDLEDKNKLLSETEQTVSLLKSDKSSLEAQLKEYVLIEETLKETLLKTQAEEQNLSKLLATEKEKAEGLITELTKIKTSLEDKNKLLSETEQTVSLLKSDKSSLETELKEYVLKEETLKETLLKTQAEEQNLLKLLTTEKEKAEGLITELTKMKTDLEDKNKQLSETEETVSLLKSDKSSLEAQLKEYVLIEETLKETLLKTQAEEQNLSKLLTTEKEKAEGLITELTKIKTDLEDKNEKINNLEQTVSVLKSEKSALETELKEHILVEESLRNDLIKSQTEEQNLSNLLAAEKEKAGELHAKFTKAKADLGSKNEQFSELEQIVSELKSNKAALEIQLKQCISDEESLKNNLLKTQSEQENLSKLLMTEKEKSEALIAELSETKTDLESKNRQLSELEQTVSSMESCKATLETQFNELILEGKSLKNTLLKMQAEEQNLSKLLNIEKEKSEEMLSEQIKLKADLDKRDKQLFEYEETLSSLKSDKASLEAQLKEHVLYEETLKDTLHKLQADEQNLSKLLSSEKMKAEELIVELSNIKTDIDSKDKQISELKQSISLLQSDKSVLEMQLGEHISEEESAKDTLLKIQKEERNLSKLLTAEKEKAVELIAELSNIKTDLESKDNIICSLNENIECVKAEKLLIEEKFNEVVLREELLRNELSLAEKEKLKISELLATEEKKVEVLESNLSTYQKDLDSKDSHIKNIDKELEEWKKHKDDIQVLENQLATYKEKEIFLLEQLNVLEKEKSDIYELLICEKNKNVSLESNIKEFQDKIMSLELELKETNETFTCFSSDVASSKENYELKLKELETEFESLKSEKENLSNQLKDVLDNESTLKDSIEKLEADNKHISEELLFESGRVEKLIISIEELETKLSNLNSELSMKDINISNLVTEIEVLKTTHEEVKCNVDHQFEGLKLDLNLMQNSFKSIVSVEESLENEISMLKEACLQFQLQNAGRQDSWEAFLYDLLNQLSVIEKHVEALEGNYEEQIAALQNTLSELEMKITSQNDNYVTLMGEKSELLENLKMAQDKFHDYDELLKKAAFIEKEHLNSIENIESLKSVNESMATENCQLQEQIVTLQEMLSELEMKVTSQNDDYATLNRERSELCDKLKVAQDCLYDCDKLLEKVAFIEEEHLSCVENIKLLKSAKESLATENCQLQEQMAVLQKRLSELDLIVSSQTSDYITLTREKSELFDKLKVAEDSLRVCNEQLEKAAFAEKEHLNCVQNIELLKRAKESQVTENCQLGEQIVALKKRLCDLEEKITSQNMDYATLLGEKTELHKKLELAENSLHDFIKQLEKAAFTEKEHLNCVQNIELLRSAKENLTTENCQLQEQISTLRKTLCELEEKITTHNSDYTTLLGENRELHEKLKTAEDSLHDSNKQLEKAAFTEKEHLNCVQNIELLRSAKENLTTENCQLQEQITALRKTLCELEEKITTHNSDYTTLLGENRELIEKLKTAEDSLHDFDKQLEKAAFTEKEHLNCVENIELLRRAEENLATENCQLQEQIAALGKTLCDLEEKVTTQNSNYATILEEKTELLGKLKIAEDSLIEYDMQLKNAALVEKKHLSCIENIELLNRTNEGLATENCQLKMQIDFISKDLQTAEKNLNNLDVKLKNVVSLCENLFSSIKGLQIQKEKISQDFRAISHDYSVNENSFKSNSKDTDDMCALIFQCIKLLEEYLLNHSGLLEVPVEVTETVNEYLEVDSSETSNVSAMLNLEEISSHIPLASKGLQMANELNALVQEVCDLQYFLEDNVLCLKEKFKFLLRHHLIKKSDFRKILLMLKFLRKLYYKNNAQCSNLQTLKKFDLLAQNYSGQEIISFSQVFSSHFIEDSSINSFFEKCLMDNFYKNMYMTCKLKKMLNFVKNQLNADMSRFNYRVRYYNAYQNIESNFDHAPIHIHSKYIIYLHTISSYYSYKRIDCETNYLAVKNDQLVFEGSVLQNIHPSKVSMFLNCIFKLVDNNLFHSNHDICGNLYGFIQKMFESCYSNENCFSRDTINIFENFLQLISIESSSKLRNIPIDGQIALLANLVSNLLQDLSKITKSLHHDKQEFQMNKSMLNETLDKLNTLSSDYESKCQELNMLQSFLQDERDKQKDLTLHVDKLDDSLNVLNLEKEKWKKKVFEMSRICSVLKSVFSVDYCIVKLESEIAALSDSFCLCQACLCDEENPEVKEESHTLFSSVNLIHFIAELFTSKNALEKEKTDLEEYISVVKQEIEKLENEKCMLQKTVSDIEENNNVLEHEVGSLKSKNICLEREYQNLNSLYSESNSVIEDLQMHQKTNTEEMRKCKNQYKEILDDYEKVKSELTIKQEEISNYEKAIEEKTSKCEILTAKCSNYASEIESLNSTITKLSELNEANAQQIHDCTEMKNKIASLEKSNNCLNLTIETVEDELQNVYTEKQKCEENLKQKMDEIESLYTEIEVWKNKIANEKCAISELENSVRALKKLIEENELKCTELTRKNSELEKNLIILEQVKKDLDDVIVEKTNSIVQRDITICELKEKLLIITEEKERLETNVVSIEANSKCQMQEKEKLLCDLKSQLEHLSKQMSDAEKHYEEDVRITSQEKESLNLKCNELISENSLLKSQLENLLEERANMELNLKMIQGKIAMIENEREEAIQRLEGLKSEKEKYIIELSTVKKEISSAKKINFENSRLISKLQDQLHNVKVSYEEAKDRALKLSVENSSLLEDISSLKTNCRCKENSLALESSNHKECATKFVNLLTAVIKNLQFGNDCDKASLISQLNDWEHNMKNSRDFFCEIQGKLQTILNSRIRKEKELEINLCNLKELICKFVSEIHQYCESKQEKHNLNTTVLGDKSCFEESFFISTEGKESYFVLNSFVTDVNNNLKTLKSYFCSMKEIIQNKELKIKSLLKDVKSGETGIDSIAEKKENKDIDSLSSKKKLLLSNAYRLEKENKKLTKTIQELDAHIKSLEEEKRELNDEADEMAEIIKQHNDNNELAEINKMLAESTTELIKLRLENDSLKSSLQQCRALLKKYGTNVCAAAGSMDEDENS